MYRQLKLFPGTEPYVRASLPVGVRRVVAGLRAGCLPLQIELGRYTSPKTPLNQRTCKLCNSGTEDQEHFLLLCPSLHEPRATLFTTLHSLDPNFSHILLHLKFNVFIYCTLSLLTVLRIAIAYPDPYIPAQQAVGMVHCHIKMVDNTDNQKKVENVETNTALCLTRYT